MSPLIWILTVTTTATAVEAEPCHARVVSASKEMRRSATDAVELGKTIAVSRQRDGEAALLLADSAMGASWILERMGDDLYLMNFTSCSADYGKVRAYVAGVASVSANALRLQADKTVLDSVQAKNAALTKLSVEVRRRIRDAAVLVERCVPPAE